MFAFVKRLFNRPQPQLQLQPRPRGLTKKDVVSSFSPEEEEDMAQCLTSVRKRAKYLEHDRSAYNNAIENQKWFLKAKKFQSIAKINKILRTLVKILWFLVVVVLLLLLVILVVGALL